VADANLKAAVRTEELLAAPPLQEDQAKADAEVLAAEGRTRTVQERIEKCSILAPIDGTVLRVYARRGESFSTVTPRPLFSLADTSARRIKAEIDKETLIRCRSTEGGYPGRRSRWKEAYGSVVRISAS